MFGCSVQPFLAASKQLRCSTVSNYTPLAVIWQELSDKTITGAPKSRICAFNAEISFSDLVILANQWLQCGYPGCEH